MLACSICIILKTMQITGSNQKQEKKKDLAATPKAYGIVKCNVEIVRLIIKQQRLEAYTV